MHIPSPPVSGFHVGPLLVHVYALMYLAGIAAAILITRRRWAAAGGDPELVYDVALWGVGRLYRVRRLPADLRR